MKGGINMLNKFKLIMLTGFFTVLTIVAQVSAASACWWAHYQPELPESLKK
jgi:cyclic lactone autoinducer peptide